MPASPKSILIVEDDDTLRDILKDNLAAEGYTVYEAPTGKRGLELALTRHPDLILLDILLPDESGLSILKKIRADKAHGSHIKIIMLTNLSDKKSVATAVELDAHSFLVKSDWKIHDVISAIHNELNDWPEEA
jgi:DNA-binding response OmpR family regulator